MIKLLNNSEEVKRECLRTIGTGWIGCDKDFKELETYIQPLLNEHYCNDLVINFNFNLSGFNANKKYNNSLLWASTNEFDYNNMETSTLNKLLNVFPLLADSYLYLNKDYIHTFIQHYYFTLSEYRYIVSDIIEVYNSLYNEDVKVVYVEVKDKSYLNPNYYTLTTYKHKKAMKFLFDVVNCFYGNKSIYVHRNPELITKIKDIKTKLFIADVDYIQSSILYELCKYYPNVSLTINKL